jgi:hypothetical protein
LSHVTPVLFLSLAHLFLDLTGVRGGGTRAPEGTLMMDAGLLLLSVVMAWGLALSLSTWVTTPMARLNAIAASPPDRSKLQPWQPAHWEIDRLASRMLSLLRQNRRGVEALSEVEAVREQAARLLKGWGELSLPGSPGPDTAPVEFWKTVRRVLVDRMEDLSQRADVLTERIGRWREKMAEAAHNASEARIQCETLFLESSHGAVLEGRSRRAAGQPILEEVRTGLGSWTQEIRERLGSEAAARAQGWSEWILHCLREGREEEDPEGTASDGRLEALSKRVTSLGRTCDKLAQEAEACHVLAMEVSGALPAPPEAQPMAQVT